MKKILAILIMAVLLAMPVLANIDLVNDNIQISVSKAAVAPVIDGKLDADSYQKVNTSAGDFLYYGDDEYMDFLQKSVPDVYISYDANNFYVFLSGDATKYYYCDHDDPDDSGNIWNQSCIQISAATKASEADARLELGLSRSHEKGVLVSHIWAGELDLVFGQNCAVLLDGGKLSYEVAIPWTAGDFLTKAPKVGDVFGFNFIYGWSDGGNRFGVEYSAGCCNGKDPTLFAQVTVTDNVLQGAPAWVAPNIKIGGGTSIIKATDFDSGVYGKAPADGAKDIRPNEEVNTENGAGKAEEVGGNIGWIGKGDWVQYTVNVDAAGTYGFSAWIASDASPTGNVEVYVNDKLVGASEKSLKQGWQAYSLFPVGNIDLAAGKNVVKVVFPAGGLNFCALEVVSGGIDIEAPPAAPVEAAPTPAPAPVVSVTPARTGDAGIIALSVAMIIAAAGVVIFRRKAVK